MIKFLNKDPQDFILSNNKPYSAKQMMAFAFKYFKLDFKDYIETNKINFRKKDFKIRISNTKKTYEKNKIKFRYKIYGKNLIEKLLKHYLKNNFLNK